MAKQDAGADSLTSRLLEMCTTRTREDALFMIHIRFEVRADTGWCTQTKATETNFRHSYLVGQIVRILTPDDCDTPFARAFLFVGMVFLHPLNHTPFSQYGEGAEFNCADVQEIFRITGGRPGEWQMYSIWKRDS
jgi:hypothetical protein